MKGVSEIIAIILILMIVIALAALAYTWFSGVFATLTGTTSTAVTQTTNQLTYQFTVDSAKGVNNGNTISLVVRNTGTQVIAANSITAYINDAPCTGTYTSNLAAGTYTSPAIGLTCTLNCACTPSSPGNCYVNGALESLKVTIGTGLAQTATVTC